MRLVTALVFAAMVSIAATADTTSEAINDKINIINTKPSVRLDPYIRKALLKALSELEESGEQTTGADGITTLGSESIQTSQNNIETETATEGIQIHSFLVNGQSAFEQTTDAPTPTIIDSKISILSTTAGNVETHVTATLPTQAPFSEIFQTQQSSVNVQQVRSIPSNPKTTSENIIVTSTSAKPRPKPKPTTTTTTTTTTPKPTHNDDGENIEEVNQRDVQVFQAPLVAAFTVQQDALGQPKKVIPIFHQTNIQEKATLKPSAPVNPSSSSSVNIVPSQSLTPHNVAAPNVNKIPQSSQSEFIAQQLALQRQLEEKQRVLEDQLRLLQHQQRQQEELLRKQQFLLQQKESQRQQQQQLFEQEQLKRQQQFQNNAPLNNFQTQNLPKPVQQNQFLNQNNAVRSQSSQVTIQPSVPIEHGSLVANQQQLPNREAVDFLLHLRNHASEQFPLQDNHLPQGIGSFLHPNTLIQSFNQIPQSDQFRQKQGNRVFRQESGVGNFGGNNQNYNRFNTFSPIYSNRFFPNRQVNQYNSDLELKQLLAQQGLSGRAHEDLNIVSKVLSLNHGVPLNNNVSNRLPFDSRRHVRPLL